MLYLPLVIHMNNIPLFASQGGTASLVLREIPFTGKAYIILQLIVEEKLPEMIAECCGFCRSCGATECFVSRGDGDDLPIPVAYETIRMTVHKNLLPPGEPVTLAPIQEANDSIYIRLYNQCFAHVSGAAAYDRKQIQRIYLLHQKAFLALLPDGTPFGFGELHDNELAAVGVLPEYRGRGHDLTLALLAHCPGPVCSLTVASDNLRALRMYEKLGFQQEEVVSRWYRG